MTDGELADELQSIGAKLEQLLADEQRRFDEDHGAIESLLQSVQDAKATGQRRKIRFNVFDVLGCTRREQAHSSFLAWLLDPGEAHGLEDKFLRQFIGEDNRNNKSRPVLHCGRRGID